MVVRWATPAARNAFNILPTDIGRRITDLRPNVDLPDLEYIFVRRDRPYRTTDNKIDGAVITLVDLEGRKDSYAGKTPRRPK